jgi:hypothetical protein
MPWRSQMGAACERVKRSWEASDEQAEYLLPDQAVASSSLGLRSTRITTPNISDFRPSVRLLQRTAID